MFCNKCGSHLKDGGKFCPECGAVIEDTTAAGQSMDSQDLSRMNTNNIQGNMENVGNNIQDVAVANTADSYNTGVSPNTADSFNGGFSGQGNSNAMNAGNAQESPNTMDGGNPQMNSNGGNGYNAQSNPNNMSNYYGQPNSDNMNHYNASSMSNGMNSYGNMPNNSNFESKPKKKFNKLALVISLVVLLVAIGAGAAILIFKPFRSKDPVKRLMIASLHNMKNKQAKVRTELSFKIDPDDPQLRAQASYFISYLGLSSSPEQVTRFLSDTFSKYKLQYNIAIDFKKSPLKLGAEVNFLYNDKQLINGGCKFRPWETSLYSDSLLSKPIYMDLGKLFREKQGIDINNVDLSPYLDILLEEDEFIKGLPKSEYVKFLSEELGVGTSDANLKYYPNEKVNFNGKTIRADKISLTITTKEYFQLLEGLLDVMAEDSEFQEFLIKKAEKILDRLLETGDYVLFNFKEEAISLVKRNLSVEDCKAYLENKKLEIESYLKLMESYELNDITKKSLNEPMMIDYYLVGDKLKKAEMTFKVNGVDIHLNTEMLNFKSSDVDFPSAEDSYNMEDILNGNINEIYMDVVSKFISLGSSENSGVLGMIEDIKNKAREYLGEEDVEKIERSLTDMIGNMGNFSHSLSGF